jgi:hypothetical protein
MTEAVATPVTPFKTCEWCNTPFDPTHWNQIYCVDHREEAKKEKDRLRQREYYKRNRKAQILRQLGTTTMSPHPNPDPERELQIVEKEVRRISVRTNSKKGKAKINVDYHEPKVLEYGDLTPMGIQVTHNYATFDDYVNTSVSIWMTSQGPCPECESGKHLKDFSRCETACECGLLLYGAPHPSFKYPDDNDEKIPICPFSHEVKNKKLMQKWNNDNRM